MLKKITLLFFWLVLAQLVLAQAPSGYYKSTKNEKGSALKTALFHVINQHEVRSYKQLWQDMKKTDRRADGKVWDMYSSQTSYTFGGSQQGATYKKEGDAYNREHSFPKSWFNDADPMYTDLFHLYPTDGYINGRRSNYPYGENQGEIYTSAGGWSKLGKCTTPGYTGTVFEPNDEYKGDFARTYFYMATCYEDQIAGWKDNKGKVFPMLNSTSYPVFSTWALDMLLRWAAEDTVSQKERDRNNEVYKIQKNRNPFIDYPGLEQYIWGTRTAVPFDPDNYAGGGTLPHPDPTPDPGTAVALPTFSRGSGTVARGTEIVISCETAGASIYFTVNGGPLQNGPSPVRYTINEDVELVAYAVAGNRKSAPVTQRYSVSIPSPEEKVYVKVKTADEVVTGAGYLLVCETKKVAVGSYLNDKGTEKKDVRGGAPVVVAGDNVTTKTGTENTPYEFTLGGTPAGYTFYDAVNNGYLGLGKGGNKLYTVDDPHQDDAKWTITIGPKGTSIFNVAFPTRQIMYNASSPRFATYEGSQQSVVLYRETVGSHIEYVEMDNGTVDVYAPDGRLLRNDVAREKALTGLPRGLYIVGGVKLIVR